MIFSFKCPDPFVLTGIIIQYFHSPVNGMVVYRNHFPVIPGLSDNRIKALLEVQFFILYCHNNGN